jgi:DNA-binding NtrC family response regulator
MRKILIVDDNEEFLFALSRILKEEFVVLSAPSIEKAREYLSLEPSLILLDIRMKDNDINNREGIDFLKEIKSKGIKIPVIMMTAYGDIDIAVASMKLGAEDFIQKGKVDIREYKKIINKVLEKSILEKKIDILQEELEKVEPSEIIGKSKVILDVKKKVKMAAEDGEIPVLIFGETGTGKEVVARAIYKGGKRRKGPFVPLALSALPKSLIESEIFGYEKGAFSGAEKRKIGHIEKADSGILFLDEIGDLDQEVQIKILRFLETKSFYRVGGTEEIKVDVQLITATNKNLEELMREGKFREDLYYRLKKFVIYLPPLRERKEDIPLLANYFLESLKKRGKTDCEGISKEALKYLENYSWPGNVRELRSCIEIAVIYAKENNHQEILPEDLPLDIKLGERKIDKKEFPIFLPEEGIKINEELAKLELKYIEEALKKCNGKKTEAWKLLGYADRFALRRKVKNIIKTFPQLIHHFPYIKKMYKLEEK